MKEMSLKDHVTALFILACCEWINGEDANANNILRVAVSIMEHGTLAVA